MSKHSVVEAKDRLSELIDIALTGEEVVITRQGNPVVELRPISPTVGRMTTEDLDRLAERRAARQPATINSVTTLRHIRDEEAG